MDIELNDKDENVPGAVQSSLFASTLVTVVIRQ